MKLRELLPVMENDQALFITIYTKAHTHHFCRAKTADILDGIKKMEPSDLKSKVVYIAADLCSSTIYIDAREEDEKDEAIPVEWIEEYANRGPDFFLYAEEEPAVIREMLEEWRKEI